MKNSEIIKLLNEVNMRFEHKLESNNLFINFKKTPSITGVFVGDELIGYKHWIESDNKRYECTMRKAGNCIWCEKGERSIFYFKVNFAVMEEGNFKMKILDAGAQIYKYLEEASKDLNISETKFKISRTESPKVSYSVIPLGQISDEVKKKIEVLQLNELGDKSDKTKEESLKDIVSSVSKAMSKQDDEDVPF